MPYVPRFAVISDAGAIADMHAETIRTVYKNVYPDSAIQSWMGGHTVSQWNDRITNPHFLHMVIDDGDDIAGCCSLNIQEGSLGVYVSPQHHRKGIASLLVQAQMQNAREKNIKKLHLSALEKAVPFYERMGFSIKKKSENVFKSGDKIDVFDMEFVIEASVRPD